MPEKRGGLRQKKVILKVITDTQHRSHIDSSEYVFFCTAQISPDLLAFFETRSVCKLGLVRAKGKARDKKKARKRRGIELKNQVDFCIPSRENKVGKGVIKN